MRAKGMKGVRRVAAANGRGKPAEPSDAVAAGSDIMTDEDLALVARFRRNLRHLPFGSRDTCVITVGVYDGDFYPNDCETPVYRATVFGHRERTIEAIVGEVDRIAKRYDPYTGNALKLGGVLAGEEEPPCDGRSDQEHAALAGGIEQARASQARKTGT